MIKLLFGLKGGNRRRRERAPCSVELQVKILELRCGRRKTLNLEALEITKFFVKPGSGLKMRQGQGGETDQYGTVIRKAHPKPVGACGVVKKAHIGAVIKYMVNLRATSKLSGRPVFFPKVNLA